MSIEVLRTLIAKYGADAKLGDVIGQEQARIRAAHAVYADEMRRFLDALEASEDEAGPAEACHRSA